jgi:tetratricopeptide (TPR) repeat protein
MELYRALFTVFPDRVDIGLRLVTAQVAAGEAVAALATVETLRALPPPRGEDPRIDLAEGEAAWAASDWDRHLRSARAAKLKAEQLGLVGLGAAAACEEGWALRYRGELEPAAKAGATCLERWGQAGNPGGEADALNFLATVDLDRGDIGRAASRYRESAALERRLGNLGGVAVASSNLGNALHDAGDLDGAADLYAEALDLFEQVGRREGVGMMHNALGNVALAAARLVEARERYGAALEVGRELGAKRLVALALNNLGNVALQTAELEAAQRSFEESLALCRELGHPRIEAYDLYGLGEVAFWRGDLGTARSRHQEALALREAAGEELLVAESQLALARVELESGEPDTAAREAAKARAVFERLGTAASEAQALALESRALASPGRQAEARGAAERAVERAVSSSSPVAKLEAGLALATVDAMDGALEAPAAALGRLGDEAAALGLVALRLEAACLAASLDPRRARDAGGASRARPPIEEARALGLGLVASRCARQDTPSSP